MLVSDFDYELPEASIAQTPRPRGESRLFVVDRVAGSWQEATIRDLPRLLDRGDLMVANDTRVFPARLIGRRDPSGGAVECLLLERINDADWFALVHPGQKLKPGGRVIFEDSVRAPGWVLHAEVQERLFYGRRRIRLTLVAAPDGIADVDRAIDAMGHVPLPPYIRRDDDNEDRERYQTIFARVRGSVAAPTAGLHFDPATLSALQAAGIDWTTLTLHVGYGTFKPVRAMEVQKHQVDAERFDIPAATVDAVQAARARGSQVVAVGTTTTRALESAAEETGDLRAGPGVAELFIYPGYRFRVVDALLTNFHLPRSSLFMLVCAFAGRELMLAAYRDAIARGFLFYSYGDAMLIGTNLWKTNPSP
jgi:S-adenosylmethionine:tRNA ribosyltransferase-isomerase